TLAFSYDAAGLMLTASNSAGTLTFSYDEEGWLESQTDTNGVTITYTRDDEGRVTQQSDSLGNVVSSTYDAEGNLTSRTLSTQAGASLRLDLGYDQSGLLASEQRYADLGGTLLVGSCSNGYDAEGRLTRLTHRDGEGAVLGDYTYGYDAGGRLTSETSTDAAGASTTTPYGYDQTDPVTAHGIGPARH